MIHSSITPILLSWNGLYVRKGRKRAGWMPFCVFFFWTIWQERNWKVFEICSFSECVRLCIEGASMPMKDFIDWRNVQCLLFWSFAWCALCILPIYSGIPLLWLFCSFFLYLSIYIYRYWPCAYPKKQKIKKKETLFLGTAYPLSSTAFLLANKRKLGMRFWIHYV